MVFLSLIVFDLTPGFGADFVLVWAGWWGCKCCIIFWTAFLWGSLGFGVWGGWAAIEISSRPSFVSDWAWGSTCGVNIGVGVGVGFVGRCGWGKFLRMFLGFGNNILWGWIGTGFVVVCAFNVEAFVDSSNAFINWAATDNGGDGVEGSAIVGAVDFCDELLASEGFGWAKGAS